MNQTFEDYLSDRCGCHTNNSPEGFDKWLEELDGEQYMEYADMYGAKMYTEGQVNGMNTINEINAKLLNL